MYSPLTACVKFVVGLLGYFRGQDVSNKPEIVVPVYERTAPAEDATPAPTPAKSSSTTSSQSSKKSPDLPFRLPQFSLRYHARLSLLLASSVACLLYVSYISFPTLPSLNSHSALSH